MGMARLVELQCTFVLMNSKNGTIIYAGKLLSETKVDGVRITVDTWYNVVNDLAGNILKKTVFKRRVY
jgi:hypothetical protein